MPVPLPLVLATTVVIVGLAVACVVVGWRKKALGPGVFILLGGVVILMAAVATAVALAR